MTTASRHPLIWTWTIFGVLALASGLIIGFGCYQVARADSAALVDAGAGSAASAPPGAAAGAPAEPAPAAVDPASDPAKYVKDTFTALRAGEWFVFGVMVLLGLDAFALHLARRYSKSWLHTLAPYLAAAGAVLGAMVTSLAAGGTPDPRALIVVAMTAMVAYLRPMSRAPAAPPAGPS